MKRSSSFAWFLVWAAILLVSIAGCSRPATSTPATGEMLPYASAAGKGLLRVSFIDIGQGDAELVQTPQGKTILIDAGEADRGDDVVRYLKSQQIGRLDYVIATHPHSDHIGGMRTVLNDLPVRQFLDSGFVYGSRTQERMLLIIRRKAISFRVVQHGDRIAIESDIQLEILSPKKPYLKNTDSDPNNNSVVCKLTYGKTAFLFTGDMEEDQRERLYKAGADLRADALKVAHHGSHNGTDDRFLKAVRPSIAVISCGKGNSYRHPHKEALTALQKARVKVFRTDLHGTIIVTSDGQRIRAQGFQATAQPDRGGATKPVLSTRQIIGNPRTRVYHIPSCSSLPSPRNRATFSSIAEAERGGYRPHSCVK